jgi:hypothetical protein
MEEGVTATTSLGLQQNWPTVDGPLGVYHDEAVKLAKSFYFVGFLCLPWLWFINCFYFWPVLRNSRADPLIRPCTSRSAALLESRRLNSLRSLSPLLDVGSKLARKLCVRFLRKVNRLASLITNRR